MSNYSAISLLKEVIKIYSPSGSERKITTLLADKMRNELSFNNVRIDDVGNVIGEVGYGKPVILLCGHMDTVPGKTYFKLFKDKMIGRGAVDAKSSLVAMLLAASNLVDHKAELKVIFAGVVDEEGYGEGIKNLLKSDLKCDYAIFGEPSGGDNITVGYKGRLCIKITCKTSSVHASAPWMSINAIEKAFDLWKEISVYIDERKIGNDHYNSLSASLTEIKGGLAENVTPDECRITIDIRIPPTSSVNQILEDVKELINRFEKDSSIKIIMDVIDSTEPFETDKNSLLVRAAVKAIIQVKGKRPMLIHKTGTGDMNVFGHRTKIPTITYGPGDTKLSHTNKECINFSDYISSIAVYKQIVLNIALLNK